MKPVNYVGARWQGTTGWALLRVHADAGVDVREVLVQSAEPSGHFEAQAIKVVQTWRFKSAMARGVPKCVWLTITLRFVLHDHRRRGWLRVLRAAA